MTHGGPGTVDEQQAQSHDTALEPGPDAEPDPVAAAPLATVATVVVVLGFASNALVYALLGRTNGPLVLPDAVRITVAVIAAGAIVGLQLGFLGLRSTRVPRPYRLAALAVQAVLILVPWAWSGIYWGGLLGFLAGNLLGVVRGPAARWCYAAVVLLGGVLAYLVPVEAFDWAYVTFQTALTGLIIYGLGALQRLLRELGRTGSELAEFAAVAARLRFTEELDRLLGRRLSALALRCELVGRQITTRPVDAAGHLGSVAGAARDALADVRRVVRSYRGAALEEEVARARSALEAAGVRTTVDLGGAGLDGADDLITLLRAATDDVLGRPGVHRCGITVVRRDTTVGIEVEADGAPGPPATAEELREAVVASGGSLSVVTAPRYALQVVLPRTGPVVAPAPPPLGGIAVPRRATTFLLVIHLGYYLNAVVIAAQQLTGTGPLLLGLACNTVVLALHAWIVLGRPPGTVALLAVQAAVAFTPAVLLGAAPVGLTGLVAGAVLVVLPRPAAEIGFVAVVAAVAAASALTGAGAAGVAYGIVVTLDQGAVVYVVMRLRSVAVRLDAAYVSLAELATARERVRFARDLHDLLGYTLSAIALKSSLAARLVGAGDARAGTEVADLTAVVRSALVEIGGRGGAVRDLPADDEIASVTSVLRAADVETVVDWRRPPLTPEVEGVIAVVLRESATNLLRHGSPTRCSIRLEERDGRAVLLIENDGAGAPSAGSDGTGSGLRNLRARVADVGGTFAAGPCGATGYRVSVEVPALEPDRAPVEAP
ncbi:hypothetical protein Acsp07_50170 [Actinomycetospora sp. NBRC 106378]|nr:hypothetical protein Acsp07_50170 [Actinomycetospora sp. NBRC 106378]